MHDQSTRGAADELDRVEQAVLALLAPDGGMWSDDEIARAIGDPIAATDAVGALHRAGLAHRLDGFVFATRPAVRAMQLG